MNITRCFMVFLAASLLLVPAAICQAQDHPAAGPVGSPEGIWRAQIHWIPMTDGAGGQHLLQARICRPTGDMPARVVVMAHGTFPSNRNTVPGRCEREAMRWFLDRGFIVVMALRRGYGATGGDWVEGIHHKPGMITSAPASKPLATSRPRSIMRSLFHSRGHRPRSSSAYRVAVGARSPTTRSRTRTSRPLSAWPVDAVRV